MASGRSRPSRTTASRPTTTRPRSRQSTRTTTTTTTTAPTSPPPSSPPTALDPNSNTFCVNDSDPAPATMRAGPREVASVVASLPVGNCSLQDADPGRPDLAVDPATGLTWRRTTNVAANQQGWVPDQDLKGAQGTVKESPADCSYSPLQSGQGYTDELNVSTGPHDVLICRNVFDGSLVYRGVDVTQPVPTYITLPATEIGVGYQARVKDFRYEISNHLRVFKGDALILDEPVIGG